MAASSAVPPGLGHPLAWPPRSSSRCTTPALFRLMFSSELVRLSRHPEAQKASEGAFARLVSIVARLAPAHRVEELSLAAWCLVHGYATLCIETRLEGGERRAERARAFARIILADARSA